MSLTVLCPDKAFSTHIHSAQFSLELGSPGVTHTFLGQLISNWVNSTKQPLTFIDFHNDMLEKCKTLISTNNLKWMDTVIEPRN